MAAEDLKTKKRKGAADAVPKPKKQKKAEDAAKPPKASKPAVESVESTKKSRKRAADAFGDDNATKEETVKRSKKVKAQTVDDAEAAPSKKSKKTDIAVEEAVAAPSEKPKKASKKQKPAKEPTPEVEPDLDAEEAEDEDQTAALLAGFESEEDENDPEADENFSDAAKVAIDKKTEKQLAKAGKNTSKPGVVYVGRIPHGFFEPQMKGYFSQFGTVTNLRLSRNKKTGASKHYAFVEFASEEVADIVARTMDKYLLFGHILQCRVIPSEQIHENLFAGANRRFKTMPRNKMAGLQMARGVEREQWEKRVKNEEKKRSAKNKKLKEDFGYEFTAPALKSVDDIPKKASALENGVPEQLLIEAPAEDAGEEPAEPEPKPTKGKKAKKGAKADVDTETAVDTAESPVAKVKKAKKEKKPKAETLPAAVDEQAKDAVSETTKKTKSKKAKDVEDAPADDAPVKETKRKSKAIEQDGVKVKKGKKVKA